MKTFLLGFSFAFICLLASAQEPRTAFDGVSVTPNGTGMTVQLSWKKGTENVSYFIVERSTNGVDFTQCGIVFTSEEAGFTDYKFRDKVGSSAQGLVYRLGLVTDQKRISYLPAKTLISPESL